MTRKVDRSKEPESPYALEGTHAHQLLAHILSPENNKAPENPEKYEEHVRVAVDYVNIRRDLNKFAKMDTEVTAEEVFDLTQLGLQGLERGTADVVIRHTDDDYLRELEIVDYKHGQGVVVHPLMNTQMMIYAVGALLSTNTQRHEKGTRVLLTICQPRAPGASESGIKRWETTEDFILNWARDELGPAVNRVWARNPDLVPTDDGCKFCPAKGICPALMAQTEELVDKDFEDIETDQEALLRYYLAADTIRGFLKKVEEKVTDLMKNGSRAFEGHLKLVRKITHRRLTKDAEKVLLEYIEEEHLYKPRDMVGIGEIEKQLKKVLDDKSRKNLVESITWKPEGEIVVAREGDRRKAIPNSVDEDFKEIEDGE